MDIEVRPLDAFGVTAADAVFREAFATVLGAGVHWDTDLVRTRFRSPHTVALAAFLDGELAGSTLVT